MFARVLASAYVIEEREVCVTSPSDSFVLSCFR